MFIYIFLYENISFIWEYFYIYENIYNGIYICVCMYVFMVIGCLLVVNTLLPPSVVIL